MRDFRFIQMAIAFLCLGATAAAQQTPPEPRIALVMGVGDYSGTKFPTLPGIEKDLAHMEAALKATGFQVTVVPNPTLSTAEEAIETFGAKLKAQAGGVGLFYFSGHGGEFEGKNYLIPKGARIGGVRDIKEEAVAAQRVLNRMEDAGARVNIVFLDCCRNDLTKAATDNGLAPMSAKGTFIGFATGTDKTSLAGSEGSPYTTFLAKRLLTPGVSILDMHTQVTADVEDYTKANGAAEQTPFQYSGLRSSFYFVPGRPGNTDVEAEIQRRVQAEMAKLTPPSPPHLSPAPVSPPGSSSAATKDAPFVNSLGMRFVPAGTSGVLFSIWDTRVKDFTQFVQESGYDMSQGEKAYTLESDGKRGFGWKQGGGDWRNPHFPKSAAQTEEHPVVCVSWEDAKAFCEWLTKKDRAAGLLSATQSYRLPKDHEWSVAVGIGDREDASASPESKHDKIEGVYPWGTQWPPPKGAGNFAGEESRIGATATTKDWIVIAGYNDGFACTSPVGSFAPNRYGLYDISGNVWQWCEDWWNTKHDYRVLRGGSWFRSTVYDLRSSSRNRGQLSDRYVNYGFRCVLVVAGG